MRRKGRLPTGIYFRGDTLWIRYRDEFGKETRESTRQSDVELAEAIRAEQIREAVMRKHFPVRRFERALFRDLLDHWWEKEGRRKEKSKFQSLMRRIDDRFEKQGGKEGEARDEEGTEDIELKRFQNMFKNKKAREVTPDIVDNFQHGLNHSGLAASSCNHYRTILNLIFNHAIRWELYDRNPVRAVSKFKEPPGRNCVITLEAFQRLLDLCDELQARELRALLIVLAVTTMRKGEVLSRKWEDVRLGAKVPFIHVPVTKNGDPKTIPLPQIVVDALRELPSYKNSSYLFPSRPTARHPSPQQPYRWDFGKEFRRVCLKAGLRKKDGSLAENLRLHDLRHFGPSILLKHDLSRDLVKKITGHKGPSLERYEHATLKLKHKTLEIIARELFAHTERTKVK